MIALPRRLLAAAMDLGWLLHLQNESTSPGLDFIAYPWVADNSALKEALAYEYRHTSEDALRDYIEEVEAQKLAAKGSRGK